MQNNNNTAKKAAAISANLKNNRPIAKFVRMRIEARCFVPFMQTTRKATILKSGQYTGNYNT